MSDPMPPHSVIARPSRLGAVWLSYRTRGLMWGLAVIIGLLATGIVWAMGLDPIQSPSSRTLTSADPAPDSPTPSASVFSNKDLDRSTNWSRLRSLQVNDLTQCEPLWTKGAMPRLESLTVYGSISDQQMIDLCALYDLKSLNLYGAIRLSSAGTRAWKNEQRMEYLRLLNFNAAQTSSALEWPPNLRILICDDTRGVDLHRLSEWRQLRLLECLSTRIVPPATGISPQVIDELRSFPQLKRLFLIELPPQFPNVVGELQTALPQIRVRPHAYDPIRVQRVIQIMICGFLVLVGLCVQLSSQFVSTPRSLTPHFTTWHFGAAIAVLLCTVPFSFVLLRWAGCTPLAAVALCGLPLFVLGLETHLYRWLHTLTGWPMPGLTSVGVLFPIVTLALTGFQLVVSRFGLDLDWFVRGEQLGLAFFLIAGASWAGWDLGLWYRNSQRTLDESGGGDIPLGLFDLRGWNVWGRNLVAVRAKQGKSEGLAMRRYDARMEKLIEQLQRQERVTWLDQWQVAGPGSMINCLQITAALMLLIGFILYMFVPGAWSMMGIFAATGGFQLLVSGLLMPLLFIWQRRPMFAMELMRPQTRRTWVLNCFQGVAWEIWLVIAVSAIFGLAVLWTGNFGDWTILATGNFIAVVFGLILLIYAMGMWALTLHSRGTVALIAVFGWLIIVLCNVMPILLKISTVDLASSTLLIPVTLFAICAIGIRLAFRSWMNWELGRNS